MKYHIKNKIFKALYITRSYHVVKPFYSGIGTILALHRVCPKLTAKRMSGNIRLEVTPEFLEESIRFFIDRCYDIISLDKLYAILHEQKVGKKFVVFTFDDGYADNFIYAYPIFKKYNVPFTIYVTTSFPDGEAILWWYLLEDLVCNNSNLAFDLDGNSYKFNCANWANKESVFNNIRSMILADSSYARIRSIFIPHGINIYKKIKELALSWSQIEELSKDPIVTIGSHTVNHRALNKLSLEEVRHEIVESKKRLEGRIGGAVNHFSYPFGTKAEIGVREIGIVRECGFKTAVTSQPGNIFLNHKNYAECLPRAIISGTREGCNVNYLNLWTSGMLPCLRNKFRRSIIFK